MKINVVTEITFQVHYTWSIKVSSITLQALPLGVCMIQAKIILLVGLFSTELESPLLFLLPQLFTHEIARIITCEKFKLVVSLQV